MNRLKKADLDKLIGYCNSAEKRKILNNSQVGYYKPKKILIACCGNCGDYMWIKITKENLK